MKVLQVINSLGTGGAEKLLVESIPLYNKQGINTDLLLLNGTEHEFLKELRKDTSFSIFSLGQSSVYNPFLLFKIIAFLKKYDVVHVHLFPALYWVALAKLISFSKVKLIYTEHSTNNRRRSSILFKYLDRFIYNQYSKIIAITKEVKEALQSHLHNINDSKFSIIENGVNLAKLEEAIPLHKSVFFKDENAFLIIMVARFFEPKDFKTVIKSLTFLPHNVKLLLVGEGILRKESEALVNALSLQDRVVFLGIRMDISVLLKTADVVVLSSRYEGLSLASIEGMASGKPFIATDVPGLTEIVKGGGLLFPYQDAEKLAFIITTLISDKLYYNQTVTSCKIRAANYSISVMIDKYIKIYETTA